MKRSPKDPLLNEVLAGEELSALRRATLESGLAAVRHRRRRRYALQICALASLPIVAVVIFLIVRTSTPRWELTSTNLSGVASASIAPTGPNTVKVITDDELFALFPNRPLALVGKPGGQQLVFLDRANPARLPKRPGPRS